MTTGKESGQEICVSDLLEADKRFLEDGADARSSGAVHQGVQSTHERYRVPSDSSDVGFRRGIACRVTRAPDFAQLGDGLPQAILAPTGDKYYGALARHAFGAGIPKSGTTSIDQGALSFEPALQGLPHFASRKAPDFLGEHCSILPDDRQSSLDLLAGFHYPQLFHFQLRLDLILHSSQPIQEGLLAFVDC
jgi:hypothetical protein